MRRIGLCLVHYPIKDRAGTTVTTAITNIDLHDIARSVYTFGLDRLYIVHPIEAQRALAEKIRMHWVTGSGGRRIPDRIKAMGTLNVVASLEEAERSFGQGEGIETWTTSAAESGRSLPFGAARKLLADNGPPVLILFGTGWGLADEVHEKARFQLEPIQSARPDGYNHLSVRAAAAITLDRLFGDRPSL